MNKSAPGCWSKGLSQIGRCLRERAMESRGHPCNKSKTCLHGAEVPNHRFQRHFLLKIFGKETRKLRLFTSKMNFQTVPLTVWAVKQVQDISFAFILYTLVERVELEKRLLHAYAKTVGAPSWHLQSWPNKRSVQLFALLAQTRYDAFGYHSCFVQIMMWKPLKTFICFHVFVPLLFLHMWLATCFEKQNKPKDCHSILLSGLLVRKFQSNKLVTHAACFLSFNFCLSYEPQQKNLDPT